MTDTSRALPPAAAPRDIAAVLRAVAPRADAAFLKASAASLPAIMAAYGFATVNAQAMLIAQCAHECGFRTFAENLNYSAQRLVQVWPKRYPTIEAARPYANNPKALAIHCYGGRGGNRPGTSDGWDYRGSGALQHTFLPEFNRVEKRTGVPVVANPDLLRDGKHADAMWKAAASFFVDRGALVAARAGDVEATTLKVNGGRNGLADRRLLFTRAVAALDGAAIPAGRTTVEQSDDAKRKAKQATTAAPVGGGTGAGGSKEAAGMDWSTAIGIGLVVFAVIAIVAVAFWRKHKRKQAEVDAMRIESIEARLALAQG